MYVFQELKQDISSFRYEVLGMMKGHKSVLSGSKMSTGASNLAYSDCPLKCSTAPPGSQMKGKLNLPSVTSSILQQSSKANIKSDARCTDHSLANGSVLVSSEITSCDKTKRDFSGLYHQIRHRGSSNAGRIFSVCEEVDESDVEELKEYKSNEDMDAANHTVSLGDDGNETQTVQAEECERLAHTPCICNEDIKDKSENDEETISRL